MITVWIREGFGNQLFTYACGYALAKERGEQLTLDTTTLDCGSFRKLELLKTAVQYDKRISYGRKEDLFSRAIWNKLRRRKAIGYGTIICKEQNPWIYDPTCFVKNKNIYLYGFWQSYHYFEKWEDDLRKMIVPNYDMPKKIQEQIQKVQQKESVAVHIRRGDYVNIGCTLPLNYYEQVLKRIDEEMPNAKYYVFSDDPEFARDSIGKYVDDAIFWEDQSEESTLNDFFLMSACRHQVIANSTFSWWAAYLNKNSEKRIYAPVWGNWKEEFYPETWCKWTERENG